jgi:hypothetical protein
MILTVEKGLSLFRYDIQQPPQNWDEKYVNIQYDFSDKGMGAKNQANLFFFSDSEKQAKALGYAAAIEHRKDKYFLSTTKLIEPIKILDLSNCTSNYLIIKRLEEVKLNVFTDEFKTYNEEGTFKQLKEIYDQSKIETDEIKRVNLLNKLKLHGNSSVTSVGLFGQRLTDFKNGPLFKEIMRKEIPGIIGYRFMECDSPQGLTYCLFDKSPLGEKHTKDIQI